MEDLETDGESKIDLSEMYRELYGTVSESCPVTSFDNSGFEIAGSSTRRLVVLQVNLFIIGTDADTELLPVHFRMQF